MTIRNLDLALRPRSVAVIGAGPDPRSVGGLVLANILRGGFQGPVWPVNPAHAEIDGLRCYPDLAALPEAPGLAVIATPAETVPGLIADLGARGGRLAVVMSGGLGPETASRQAMLDAARPHLLRVIGPSSAGLIVPAARLNASTAHIDAPQGQLALLSQSAAIAFSMLDWAAARGIGFSQIVSLGEMADVDVGDYLDLLAGEGRTRAILVYLESIPAARKFLSAARAVSRLKPVIAIKAGREAAAARAAATHTGVLSGADQVVEAALRRSGILRVRGLAEMFSAAETVARFRPLDRARLGIVTNGGAAGVLAADRLSDVGGELAALAPETIARVAGEVGARWSRSNPVDINGDAGAEDYLAAMRAVAGDPGVDVVMPMNCPSGLVSSAEVARAVAREVSRGMIGGKPVIACWLGAATAAEARGILRAAGVASYDNPGAAAAAVSHLTNWGKAQAAVLRVPDRAAEEAQRATPDDARARVAAIFAKAAGEGRRLLTEPEAKAALAAYGVPSPATRIARDVGAVRAIAEAMLREAPRLVVKVISHEVSHKSEVGGVVLGIATVEEAVSAAEGIAERLATADPPAVLSGFALQPMIDRASAHELILGVARDPVFGPVILFGAGGVAVEVVRDTAVALPPLDASLAQDLIAQTRVSRLLEGYRGIPPADGAAIQGALIALSHLIEDFPCLRALDINPLLADAQGVTVLDARIEIEPADLDRRGPNPDLAIRPYPAGWRREIQLRDGVYTIRPILPVDATLYPDFHAHLSAEDIRMRFLAPRRSFSQTHDLRQTQLDYDREMAFIAIAPSGEMAGVSRLSADPDKRSAEYALLVRSDMNGRGLGRALMALLIEYARAEGLERLEGMVLAGNRGMRRLIESFGFTVAIMPEEPEVTMSELIL
ncbi:MAG: GNAT family N-acetyltransferase [Rhodovulum sulfidophilum]|uniref:GNAT family N-acetyltransferase n=1 Tax=Rhodovulum sulfidophilum TaxID=35806 RepID=A0A2W5PUU1_RHOSU|nr:MAG: GNAT family N-acetyltransferase [Rhodovulum sulfidophilum]